MSRNNPCIIIPSYRGNADLLKCLRSINEHYPGSKVIVVDDASQDGTVDEIKSRFSAVDIIERAKNGGFSKAVNDGTRAADSEFIVLLNNDTEVTPGFIESILPLFDDDQVFAVSPKIVLPKMGNLDEGAKTGYWHHGFFYAGQIQDVKEVRPVLYTTGCAAVYRRSMIEVLGGFDEAYSPFYWEDADLGYRAWKRGWISLYQPAGLVYHQHSATITKIRSSYTNTIKSRNSLFFIWRNIEDSEIIARHRMWLPFVVAKRAAMGDVAFVRGWKLAFSQRHQALDAKNNDRRNRKLDDREIFEKTGIRI